MAMPKFIRALLKFIRALTPLGRWVVSGILIACFIAGFVTVQTWRAGSVAKTEAKLSRNQTEAALNSGADAVETVGAVGASADQSDAITRENDRAIRTAPGADAPVDPAVHAAGIASLCRRAANRQRPECLQQPAAD